MLYAILISQVNAAGLLLNFSKILWIFASLFSPLQRMSLRLVPPGVRADASNTIRQGVLSDASLYTVRHGM